MQHAWQGLGLRNRNRHSSSMNRQMSIYLQNNRCIYNIVCIYIYTHTYIHRLSDSVKRALYKFGVSRAYFQG